MKAILLLAAVVAAVLVPSAISGQQPTLTAHSSSFGKSIFDGRGFVLYAFTRDKRASACYGVCAKAWPPYFAPRGELRVGRRPETLAARRRQAQEPPLPGHRRLILRPSGAYRR